MVARLAGRVGRGLALSLVLSVVAPTLGWVPTGSPLLPRAHALEVPTDGASDPGWSLQTNGAAAGNSTGDWYTSSTGGDGAHYVSIVVPCGWPAATPVAIDLYSPEINRNGPDVGDLEEPGNGGTARFSLYGPYTDRTASDAARPDPGDPLERASGDFAEITAPGTEPGWVRFATIDVASTGCGIYLLRSAILEPTSTAQNGWRLRVGSGAVGAPLDADPDGTPGTDDELLIAVYDVTFQNDAGSGGCLSLYEYVQPSQTEVRFHNFDADGGTTLSYIAPSGATPGSPTLSGDATWNNGRAAGDLVDGSDVESGWWRIDHCADDHDQFIQEGQTDVMAFLSAPPRPVVTATKTAPDGPVVHGEEMTYTIAVTDDPSADGAAVGVQVTDVLPAGATFVSCAWQDAAGSCGASGGTVTAERPSIHAGQTAAVDVTVSIGTDAVSPLSNTATVAYSDAIGNGFTDVTTSTTTTTVWSPATGGQVCWAGANATDELVRVDLATGAVDVIGALGVPDVEAMAVRPATGTLYAADEDQLGTVDTTTGTFTATSSTLSPATDVNALAFHPYSGVLYGVDSVGGEDELYTIDPVTGAVTSGPIVIDQANVLPGLNQVDGLAISPLDGTAYIIANNGGNDRLAELDLATGAVVDLGTLEADGSTVVDDVEGLSVTADGTLLATSGDAGNVADTLFELTPTAGGATPSIATVVSALEPGGDHEALACSTAAPNVVAGTLYEDRDADGSFDTGEPTREGVRIDLHRTDGTLLASTTTAAGGTYEFAFVGSGTFEVVLDTADASFTGELVTPDDVVAVDFGSSSGGARTVDFWYRSGSIRGLAWLDRDHDGLRGVDDGALLDGTVTITVWEETNGTAGLQTSGTPDTVVAGPTATTGTGGYDVTDLAAGTYYVVADPGSRTLTLQDVGGDDTIDSDVDPVTGASDAIVLGAGDQVTDVDVGVWEPGAVTVRVFEDADGDGALGAGDTLLDGVPVRLYRDTDASGSLDIGTDSLIAGPASTTGGAVTFTQLEPDTYFSDVDESAVAPRVLGTGNDPATIAVVASETATVDVGYYVPARVGDRVWHDLDADGVQDAGEPGLAGVTVRLHTPDDLSNGSDLASTTTDLAGAYSFADLAPGEYVLVVETPAGTVPTIADAAADDVDSDVTDAGTDPATSVTATIVLASGDDVDTVDAGFASRGAIAGIVFDDVNGDGDPAGDPGLVGIEVQLRLPDATLVATRTTDAEGRYRFDVVPDGTYEVHVVDPDRYVLTTANDPTTVVISAGTSATLDVGFQAFAPAVTLGPAGDLTTEVGPDDPVQVVHPHTVTNAGNVTDTYDLTTSGGTWSVSLIRDDDADGTLDAGETTTVTDTGPLDPDQTFAVLAVVSVPAGSVRGADDAVVVTATSRVGPDDPGDPAITDAVTDVTTVRAPVLRIVKTSGLATAFATPGQRIPYTVEITGLAPDADVTTARDVVLDDVLADPSHGSFDPSSFTVDGVPQPDPTSFPLALGDIAPGTSVTVAFDLVLAQPLPDGTTVTDVATATVSNPQLYDAGDTPVAEVSDAVTETVAAAPSPQLTLTAAPAGASAVAPGTLITYTLTVANRVDATETWRAVDVVQDLPSDATYVPGSATLDGAPLADAAGGGNPFDPAGAGVAVGDLAPGDAITATMQATVDEPATDGTTLTAVASATGDNAGPLLAAVTHTVDVTTGVDLTAAGAQTVEPGTTVTYAHLLTNTGNVPDRYDLGADSDTGTVATLIHDLDGDGEFDTGEPAVTSSDELAPGTNQRLLVLVEVPAGTPGGTVDTVTVVATSRRDPATVAQTFDVTTVVAGQLTIAKSAAPSSSAVNPGQVVTYLIEVRNTGGAPVRNVTVTDDTPSSAIYRAGTTRLDGVPLPDRDGGDGNPLHGDAGGLRLGDLAVGATRSVSFEVQVRSPLPDGTLLVNVASAASEDGQQVSDSVSQLVTASAVIDVAKVASPVPGEISPGTVLTYTISVRNVGNATATDVRVTDEIPVHTTYVSGSTQLDGSPVADAGAGAPAPLDPTNGGLALGSLDPGDPARTITFQATVDDPLPQDTVVSNVAHVSTGEGVTARSVAVRHTVRIRPGVVLEPDRDTVVEAPGQAIHPHQVTNTGTGTDTLVLGAVSSQAWAVTLYRDDDRDGTWDLDEGTVVGSTGPLAPGEDFRFFVVVDVPDATPVGTVDVTTVRATSTIEDGVGDAVVDTTTVVAPALGFAKTAEPSGDQVNPGQSITYRLVVTNRGRAAAQDALVTDDTPSGTTYVPGSARVDGVTVADEPNGDGNPFALANAGHVLSTVEPGSTVTLSFVVVVPLTATLGDTVTNSATLSVPDRADATAERTHTVSAGPVLDLEKTSDIPETQRLTAGDVVTYTIRVANVGAALANDVEVIDDTPLHTTYVAGSATVDDVSVPDGGTDPNPFGSAAGGHVVGDLAPDGAPVVLRFQVEVIGSVDDGDHIDNTATATSTDGASGASPVVRHLVDVTPGVTLDPERDVEATAGSQVVLAHTLTNTGDVPDSYDLSVHSARGWTARIVEDADGDGELGALDPELVTTSLVAVGDTVALLVVLDVPTTASASTTDDVTLRARSVEDPAVAAAVRDTVVVIEGALTLTKAASPAALTPGATATYTLTVANDGTAPVPGVRLFDTAPAGTTYLVGSVTVDGDPVADGADDGNPLAVGLPVGDLEVGQSVVVRFQAIAGTDADRSVVVNAAEAVSPDAPSVRAGTVQVYDTERGLDLTPGTRAEVAPGTTVEFAHAVTNVGDLADEVVLAAASSFELPVVLVVDADGDGTADPTEPEVEGAIALDPGEVIDVVAVLQVPADAPSGLEDSLVVTATSLSTPSLSITATDVITVVAPVLEVRKAAQPDATVEPGGQVRYGIVVTNTGNAVARQVVLTDAFPAGTEYVPASTVVDDVPVGDVDGVSPLDPAGPGLALGELAPEEQIVVLTTVRVRPDVVPGAVLTNVATASADGLAPVPSSPATLTVVGATLLDVRKTASPADRVPPGGTLRWTITVTNVGELTVPDLRLTDVLSPELSYVEGSTTVDGVAVADGIASGAPVSIGGLDPGQTRTVVFDTTVGAVAAGTLIDNAVTATNALTGTEVLSATAAVTVDPSAVGLPATGLGGGRTLVTAIALLGAGWALLYVARPARRPRVTLQRRDP